MHDWIDKILFGLVVCLVVVGGYAGYKAVTFEIPTVPDKAPFTCKKLYDQPPVWQCGNEGNTHFHVTSYLTSDKFAITSGNRYVKIEK
jgi:hypothetical protein